MSYWRLWLLAKLRMWNQLSNLWINLAGRSLRQADRVKYHLALMDEAEDDESRPT